MIEDLLHYDTQLFLYLNNLGNEGWDGFWQFVTEKWSSIPLYALLLFLIYREFGAKTTGLILLTVTLMVTATDQLANLFKYVLFQRPRPCRVETLKPLMRFVADGCGRYGYFSAHAASSMAVAVFIGLLLRHRYYYLPFIMLLWAVATAYSRIYLGVHYPLDIVTGMFFGGLLGWGFYLLQKWLKNRYLT
ncbi:MAG: phosphatase PAP2 family protein [Flavobacteriaceae bacterium]|nr:phosphatase PAP2 family protein [Flavobacteriaceae bacterium]